jgi:hypothetical protein
MSFSKPVKRDDLSLFRVLVGFALLPILGLCGIWYFCSSYWRSYRGMRTGLTVLLIFVAVISHVKAEDYGVFVSDQTDRELSSYLIANAPRLTNACADTAMEQRYRVIVSQVEYKAGWAALSQAKKDAAKLASETERTDFRKWDAKLVAIVRGLTASLPVSVRPVESNLVEKIRAELKK